MVLPLAEDRPVRWGILGAGAIADKFCHDLRLTPCNVAVAVGARDAGRASEFAGRHGIQRSYGGYFELVNDDELDVIYIATTHPGHHAQALLAIGAGRSVLVEKPVSLNAADASEVFSAAAAAGVFAMEAMWMRANPLIRKAQHIVAEGVIGEVVGLRHEFGIGLAFDPRSRIYDLDNGGGALLDLGIYPATLAFIFLGAPDQADVIGTLAPTGADDTVTMLWSYAGVLRAHLWCSASIPAPNDAVIYGSDGWIALAAPAHRPSALVVHARGRQYRVEDPIEGQGHGYGPEIEEVERCLRAGLTTSPLIPPADTIAILGLLDQARASMGVSYPGEHR